MAMVILGRKNIPLSLASEVNVKKALPLLASFFL